MSSPVTSSTARIGSAPVFGEAPTKSLAAPISQAPISSDERTPIATSSVLPLVVSGPDIANFTAPTPRQQEADESDNVPVTSQPADIHSREVNAPVSVPVKLVSKLDKMREFQRSRIRTRPQGGCKVILSAAGKGGIGKTYTSIETANALNDTLGSVVLVLDINAGGNANEYLGLETDCGKTIIDLYEAITKDEIKSVSDLMTFANRTDTGVPVVQLQSSKQQPVTPAQLEDIIVTCKQYCEYIFMDGDNATAGALMVTAATLADVILITTSTNPMFMRLFDRDLKLIEAVERNRNKIILVINQVLQDEMPVVIPDLLRKLEGSMHPIRLIGEIEFQPRFTHLMWRNLPESRQDNYRELAATIVDVLVGRSVQILPDTMDFVGPLPKAPARNEQTIEHPSFVARWWRRLTKES